MLALCFPRSVDRFTVKTLKFWRDELVANGCILLYTIDGRDYGYFPTWKKYQRIYDLKSKFPKPPVHCGKVPDPPASCGKVQQAAAQSRSYLRSKTRFLSKTKTKKKTVGRVKGGELVGRGGGNGTAGDEDPERKSLLAAQAALEQRKAILKAHPCH